MTTPSDRGRAARRNALAASMLLAAVAALPATAAIATAQTSSCTPYVVAPGPNTTAAFTHALAAAAAHPVAGLLGPTGEPQGRVFLRAGKHHFDPITMVSNVRIEIAPGATLRPRGGSDGPGPGDWDWITFGTEALPVTNVSLVAGDGCGGPGVATPDNKPTNTDFRGNAPLGGMANAPVPSGAWPTDGMWVIDLDPTGVAGSADDFDPQADALGIRRAHGVLIQSVFSIQDAARTKTGVGPIEGKTSRTTVIMIDPYDGSTAGDVPSDVRVAWHYNILSPSGQGPNQVRACLDCTFDHVYSHGGTALRVETDGVDGGCDGPGSPAGVGVYDLSATDIEGEFGNHSVALTPHCLVNGDVRVSNVRGTSQYRLVAVAPGQRRPGGAVGSFGAGTLIRTVKGCGGSQAQDGRPSEDSYVLVPSLEAVSFGSGLGYANGAGIYSWPVPALTGGLPDGLVPAGVMPVHPDPSPCLGA